jgi:long-chain acyl-CoA synthetase
MSPAAHMVTEPTGSSLQRLAEAGWERTGDESVLIFEEQHWTGRQLARRARQLASGLRGIGLRPGDRVVVCMANCPEVNVTYHAVWRVGGVVAPALFLLSEDELRHVLTDSGAVLVVTTREFLPKITAAAHGSATLRAVVVAGPEPAAGGDEQPTRRASGRDRRGDPPQITFSTLETGPEAELVDADPASPAALMYTGGTTGRSKGVLLSHNALSCAAWAVVSAEAGAEGFTDPAMPTLLLPLPLAHVYGLMVTVAGVHAPRPRTSVLMRWFDPVQFLDLAEKHRARITAVVPSMLQLLLQQPLEQRDLVLERVGCGAAPLPQEVAEAFCRRVPGADINEGYGCTETASIISTTPRGQARPGSVGLPVPGVTVRIERLDGSPAEVGQDGEICVRGPLLMTEYWQARSETEQALRDGWFHTGDIGRLDADGYLYVVDRIKDLIIRGGFNVYPRDVEEVLLAHPDVIGAAVIGRPDPTYGEEVVAYVRLRPGVEANAADLTDHAKEHLSSAKYPREVRIVDDIPLTSVGKIDRKRLRQTEEMQQ